MVAWHECFFPVLIEKEAGSTNIVLRGPFPCRCFYGQIKKRKEHALPNVFKSIQHILSVMLCYVPGE